MNQCHSRGSSMRWEVVSDHAKAVKYGNAVYVSATQAEAMNDHVSDSGDAYAQAVNAMKRIQRVLHKAGACGDDVVRTRIYLTDPDHWTDVLKAHREHFPSVVPANTLVVIKSFTVEDCLVEIEADAILRAS